MCNSTVVYDQQQESRIYAKVIDLLVPIMTGLKLPSPRAAHTFA
jgi:hypothetical protein